VVLVFIPEVVEASEIEVVVLLCLFFAKTWQVA
jgi:hypothetical protein